MIEAEAPTLPDVPDVAGAWFIARAAPRCERRALMSLRESGIVAYLPCEIRWRRTRNAKERVKLPLFGGYLFIRLPLDAEGAPHGFHIARACDGVSSFVTVASKPAYLPSPWVERLMSEERSGLYDRTPPERSAFTAGQAVRIIRGQFAGVLATVHAPADKGRVRITGNSVFAKGEWTVDADDLEPAAA